MSLFFFVFSSVHHDFELVQGRSKLASPNQFQFQFQFCSKTFERKYFVFQLSLSLYSLPLSRLSPTLLFLISFLYFLVCKIKLQFFLFINSSFTFFRYWFVIVATKNVESELQWKWKMPIKRQLTFFDTKYLKNRKSNKIFPFHFSLKETVSQLNSKEIILCVQLFCFHSLI